MNNDGWIGVDLDGTLAKYSGWTGDPFDIGEPIPKMVRRVKDWLANGQQVWIVTARINFEAATGEEADPQFQSDMLDNIQRWVINAVGRPLPITYKKNRSMIELWDDRVVQVIPNTGERVDGKI